MKILVTGGAGYIGSHVVLGLCNSGYEVVVLDDLSTGNQSSIDERAEFILGSTHVKEDVDKALNNIECVIHLAAFKAAGESMSKPMKYSQNNINGTISLLNSMIKKEIKYFIFSSTAAVYGNPKYLPIDEKHPLNPINFYGFTKLEIERILEWYGNLIDLKFVNLRYFNAAGHDPSCKINHIEKDPQNLIPIVMEVASGKREKVKIFGNDYKTKDGTGHRDYIHVTDLANAHIKSIEYLKNQSNVSLNLSTGDCHSVLDIIQMTKEISNQDISYEFVERRDGDPDELYANSSMANNLLSWKPKYSTLRSIIETSWNVYSKNF